MRSVPIALGLLALAAPAAAQPPRPTRPSAAEAARALNNPVVQDAAAQAVAQLAGIVLDTRVGPLAALADPRDDIRPSDTLRDVEQRRDPQYERHLYDKTRRAVGTAVAVAGGAVAEAGELQRTAERLRQALAPLTDALRSRDEAPPNE